MRLSQLNISSLAFACLLLLTSTSYAQEADDGKHLEVSLRMIGHQILLSADDSTSRVLPIIKNKDQYRIQFDSAFTFIPEELATTVNRVVEETRIGNAYIVEVENSETGEVVYSFEMDHLAKKTLVPCGTRAQPKSPYSLLFTLTEPKEVAQPAPVESPVETPAETNWLTYIVIVSLLGLMVGVFFFLWKRKKKSPIDPNWIPLGEYHFDKRNTVLLFQDQKIELTGKESDLLLLLYDAANTTVEREVILNRVWGDEGAYVGRTLDVFISKLRKKLEADSSVKIVNIRGVGYKLMLEVS